MSWGTVRTTMQRSGSDPCTCVLLRLPWESTKMDSLCFGGIGMALGEEGI